MNPALTLDPDTDDLALDGGRLALARPETTVATIVTTANRGEIKELPLIGGEALRQQGTPHQGLWLPRLRKQLTAVGLKVSRLEVADGQIEMEVE